MTTRRLTIFLALIGPLAACGSNTTDPTCTKAEFQIAEGAELDVFVNGDVAYVDCPYTCELPTELTDSEIIDELDGPASLTITNQDTNTTVNLTQAIAPQLDTPSAAGEWSVEIDREAGNVRINVFNDLGTGQQLRAGTSYESAFSLGPNSAVEEIDAATVTLNVQAAP